MSGCSQFFAIIKETTDGINSRETTSGPRANNFSCYFFNCSEILVDKIIYSLQTEKKKIIHTVVKPTYIPRYAQDLKLM